MAIIQLKRFVHWNRPLLYVRMFRSERRAIASKMVTCRKVTKSLSGIIGYGSLIHKLHGFNGQFRHSVCLTRSRSSLLLNITFDFGLLWLFCFPSSFSIHRQSFFFSLSLPPASGHNGAITSMIVPQQSQYLITGCEDTDVILWDMKTLFMKLRIR